MGTGIGVNCDRCGTQLTYDLDALEIARFTRLDEDGRLFVAKRPVHCHRCVTTFRPARPVRSAR